MQALQTLFTIIFLVLSITAPWIFKKWERKGEWFWMLATMTFLLVAIWVFGTAS